MTSIRRAAAERLGAWLKDRYIEAMMTATKVMARPTERLIGESDWHPILATSLGPEIGRCKYELWEVTRTWHIEGGEIIRHEPRTQIRLGDRTISEYDV